MTKTILSLKNLRQVITVSIISTIGPALSARLRGTPLIETSLPSGLSMGVAMAGGLICENLGFFKPTRPIIFIRPSYKKMVLANFRLLALLEIISLMVKQFMNFMDCSTSETDMDLVKNIAYTIPVTTYLLTFFLIIELSKADFVEQVDRSSQKIGPGHSR